MKIPPTARRLSSRIVGASTLAVGVLAASLTGAAAGGSVRSAAAPRGAAAPARLAGLYEARFSPSDEQTSGLWHIRISGHHLNVWNKADQVASSPSFEGGPVSFRGDLMIFARDAGQGVCGAGATYRWTLARGVLRFRLHGADSCQPRVITYTPHPWHRVS